MTVSQTPPELIRIWIEFIDEPTKFVERFWPAITLAPYQRAILESVRDNPETWVHSANEMGKSFVAALAAIWWFSTREAKVVTSSTTQMQLRNILWGEIDHLFQTARVNAKPYRFGFRRTHLRVEHGDGEQPEKKFYLLGQVTEKVESFQGHHLKKHDDGTGTVLFIFEEASGLEREFYEAATSQAHSILVIGNPLSTDGIFYEKCRLGDQSHPDGSGRLFRKVIHVSGDDSPNVIAARQWKKDGRVGPPPLPVSGILSYDQYLERRANWPPDKVRSRLLGLFPDEAERKLFPPDWLDLAQRLGAKLRLIDDSRFADESHALGIDVAQGGGDLTVWCVVCRFGVRRVLAKPTPNTAEIAGMTLRLMKEFGIRGSAVAFDAGGGGKQIADMLRDRGYAQIVDVEFGGASREPDEYKNRRAEIYGELRKALEPTAAIRRLLDLEPAAWRAKNLHCLALPPDDALLRQDLAVLPLMRDGEGRLRLPPKDVGRKTTGRCEPCVRALLHGRSPDRGDALALAFFAWSRLRERERLETVDRPLVW
ncbi:MAG TPA: hypothetical protein VMV69_18115 [Pirellulales bacterium]|nr:hypothetical protein [Pirellulales bacterium]